MHTIIDDLEAFWLRLDSQYPPKFLLAGPALTLDTSSSCQVTRDKLFEYNKISTTFFVILLLHMSAM